jgi:hypothetical protein
MWYGKQAHSMLLLIYNQNANTVFLYLYSNNLIYGLKHYLNSDFVLFYLIDWLNEMISWQVVLFSSSLFEIFI